MRADGDTALSEDLPGDAARENQRSGQPAGEHAAAAGIVVPAETGVSGIICMPRTNDIAEIRVVRRPRIRVLNEYGEGRAGCPPVIEAGENTNLVRFLPGRRRGVAAWSAPMHMPGKFLHIQREAGRQSVQHGADSRPVRFAEKGDGEMLADCGAHGDSSFQWF